MNRFIFSKNTLCIIFILNLPFLNGYIHFESLKAKIFHKILVNKKIKTDFKEIEPQDAYQLACFWYDELSYANSKKSYDSQGIDLLYRPTKHIFENSVNLTDIKYNILINNETDQQYFIWRPKIQINLSSLHSMNIATDNNDSVNESTTIYPSFRETMYLLSLNTKEDINIVTINNIVQSPYWNEHKDISNEIFESSLEKYFVKYLKYSGLNYK
jgi:hypothetical protein